MTDKELLTLAAKAAGYRIKWAADDGAVIWIDDVPLLWNPLTDDGDALALAVHLNIDVLQMRTKDEVWAQGPGMPPTILTFGSDKYAATRRAITRAAAAIGENMP